MIDGSDYWHSDNQQFTAFAKMTLCSVVFTLHTVWTTYIAHETAICLNPPTHKFAEDIKNLSKHQHFNMLSFYANIKNLHFFCGHHILTEGVFVTQLSSNAETSVWRIVWVMTNCHFMSKNTCAPTHCNIIILYLHTTAHKAPHIFLYYIKNLMSSENPEYMFPGQNT